MSQLELIRNEIVELQDEMEAIINAAEMEEGSELDEQDADRVDEILEEIAERLRPAEARLVKVEEEKQRIAASRKVAEPQAIKMPAVARRNYNLKAFVGEDAQERAFRAGQWLKAVHLKDEAAKQYCADYGIVATWEEAVPALKSALAAL